MSLNPLQSGNPYSTKQVLSALASTYYMGRSLGTGRPVQTSGWSRVGSKVGCGSFSTAVTTHV